MKMADEARALYAALNGEGDVWGNGALGVTAGYNNFTYKGKPVTYRTSMDHLTTGFLEGAGGYWYINPGTGDWIVEEFQDFLEGVIEASTAGKSVILHFSPGPAFPPIVRYPLNPSPGYNAFLALDWRGRNFSDSDAVRQASADSLVQTLAPFLIVVNEHVFLQYSWFYEMQDGNIPCPAGIECGMPSSWYPEFSKPLGPPKGARPPRAGSPRCAADGAPPSAAAVKNGYIWTRDFEHASVYVDVRNRNASKIDWH